MEHFRAAGELSVKLILILGLRYLQFLIPSLQTAIGRDLQMPSKEIKIQNSGNLFLSL